MPKKYMLTAPITDAGLSRAGSDVKAEEAAVDGSSASSARAGITTYRLHKKKAWVGL